MSPKKIALAALALALILLNAAIFNKEDHLANGSVVYIELAPVDPRSLMQGDYMALRFAIASDVQEALMAQSMRNDATPAISNASSPSRYVVVTLDARRVGTFARLDNGRPLAGNEVRMRYRIKDNMVKLATNAYFFQEGTGPSFALARYGQFRVNDAGELLLATLHGEDLGVLNASKR